MSPPVTGCTLIFVNARATLTPDNSFIKQRGSMKAFHRGLAAEYDQLLARRELELCAVLRRLSAMPATPYCASCQSAHEQLSSPSRH
jgi:hypothetical protein